MRVLIGIPIFAALAVLQSTVLSHVSMLKGAADLILVFTIGWSLQEQVVDPWWWVGIGVVFSSLTTAIPLIIVAIPYIFVLISAVIMRRRFWQSPILVMITMTILAILIQHSAIFIYLSLRGSYLPFPTVQNQITLPSILLNIAISIPAYIIVKDLARALYQKEVTQ